MTESGTRPLITTGRAEARWWLSLAISLMTWAGCGHSSSYIEGEYGPRVVSDLELLKAATARFTTIDSAVAAGYPRVVKNCLVHEHHGAMGFHHLNPALADAVLDIAHPEILLYERMWDREYHLNGVEFIVPYRSWPRDSVAPEVMGQKLMHEDNLRIWYLHVWAWKQNPEGLFANFHPAVQCPADARVVFKPSGG